MTTAVTVKNAGYDVYVYQADLDENKDGEFRLVATITEGEQTFCVHSSADLMITENELSQSD